MRWQKTTAAVLFVAASVGPRFCAAQFGGRDVRLNRITSGTITILHSADRSKAWGYSKFVGKWEAFQFPEKTVAVTVLSDRMAAFQITGDSVPMLVAFSGSAGKWATFPLAMLDQPKVATPIVGEEVVCFQLKGKVVAYSGLKNVWAALETTAVPVVSDDTVVCETDKQISIFSAHTGTWATVSPE